MKDSSKFGYGLPFNDSCVTNEQREIAKHFKSIAGIKTGWHTASIQYKVNEYGEIDTIGETKVYATQDEILHIKLTK